MTRKADEVPENGEFRSGPIAGTAFVSGVTFTNRALLYAEVDGMAVFEGDILLGTVEQVKGRLDQLKILREASGQPEQPYPLQSIIVTGQQFRWPNATIPYDIEAGMPNQQRITDAIAHWEANTPIRFVLRTAANAAANTDYVHFMSGSGCSSYVGRQGGSQALTLGSGCGTGNAIHEIGHAVGLWHEQSREDRDSFVRIVWANIDPAMQYNFTQHISDGDDVGPYDYSSIMHYPPHAFSINGQPTIVALQLLPAGVVIGQRNGLSKGDINGVLAMYPVITIKEVAKDPVKDAVRDTLKEVRKDMIRDTIKEVRKDPVLETRKELVKDPLTDPGGKIPAMDPPGTLVETVIQPGQPIVIPQTGITATPYILASPSRAEVGANQVLLEVATQVQELAGALAALEEQRVHVVEAYNAALQALDDLQKGQI